MKKNRFLAFIGVLLAFGTALFAQLPIILEAERANIITGGARIERNDNWPAGEYYVKDNFLGSYIQFNNIQIEKEGVYNLEIVYLTRDNKTLSVVVNDEPVIAEIDKLTESWDNPPTVSTSIRVYLQAGKNIIKVQPIKSFGPNLDKLIIDVAEDVAEDKEYHYDLTCDADIIAESTNETLLFLTDNKYNTSYRVEGVNHTTVTVDCRKPVLLSGYLLSAGKNNPQDLTTWKLEASNDNKEWSPVKVTSSIKNEHSTLFHIKLQEEENRKLFRYYRLTAYGETNVEIAELQLFGIPHDEDGTPFKKDLIPGHEHTSGTPWGAENATYHNLFDRNLFTTYAGFSEENFMVTAEMEGAKRLTHYTLTSAATHKQRDPMNWILEGYNGYGWETIHTVTNFSFPCRLTTMKFEVETSDAYEAFRLRMLSTYSSTHFQLQQWQLFGEEAVPLEKIPAKWSKLLSPITTPWYDTIDLENVLGEYPRPQMVRENWVNLNGIWDFKESIGMGKYRAQQRFDKEVLVPFPIESALSGLMLADHDRRPYSAYLYNRTFTIPSSMKDQRILLHFGAVDWKCEVYVNGYQVGTHEGGYDPFWFDITDALNTEEEQELQVQFMDPSDWGGQPAGKQRIQHEGMWYTPSSGIWQTVWFEGVNESYISDFTIIPDIDKEEVLFKVEGVKAENAKVTIRIYKQGNKVVEKEGDLNKYLSLAISEPELWSPDSPFLYDVEMELKVNNRVTDFVESYFGMRKISLGKVDGIPCFMLNNKPIFQHGPLDQGYWPEGLHTAPSDEALIFDIEKTKEFGFNMSRKHIKTEPARWYYHCDKIGLLVWQDMPCLLGEKTLLGDEEWTKENFIRETKNIVSALKNYPSIVSWVVFNEAMGQYTNTETHTRNSVEAMLSVDATRLINPASGWVSVDTGHILDRHSYPVPAMYEQDNKRISVCGEYGGITLVVEDHIWKGSEFVYISVKNGEEFKDLFMQYINSMKNLQAAGLWGAVYTQLTDLEEEVNGLITYDRKVIKVDEKQMAAIREALTHTIEYTTKIMLPTALVNDNVIWKYTTATPAVGWNQEGFDYSSWNSGRSGFGDQSPPESMIRTVWNTTDIYLRKTFDVGDLSTEILDKVKLSVYYDEDCEVYINGILAFSATGYITNYKITDITPEAKAAIRPNAKNLIAIKCYQTTGGQYIDAGLLLDIPVADLIPDEETGFQPISDELPLVKLYPNPTGGVCYVDAGSLDLISIKVYDIKGELKKVETNSLLNVEDLIAGIYFLEVQTNSKVYPLKLLKR